MSAPITIQRGPGARSGELLRNGSVVGDWIEHPGGPAVANLDGRELWSIDATGIRDLLTRRGFEVAR